MRASCAPCHHGTSTWPTLIPNAVFLQWQTLKCLKRLKGHALISSAVILETKECTLKCEEGDNLINMQLCSQLLRGSGNVSDENVRVCAAMSSHSACGQGIKPLVIPVSLSPRCPSTLLISVISAVQHWSLTYASYWRLNTRHLPQPALTTGTTSHPLSCCQSSTPTPLLPPRWHTMLQRVCTQPDSAMTAVHTQALGIFCF